MDRFFIHIIILPEMTLAVIGIGIFVLGALLATWRLTVTRSMGRIAYLWVLAGVSLSATLLQLGWFASAIAADVGALWLLASGIFASIAGLGAVLYWASAARSNHVVGETKYAWMGFVPIASLVLMLAGPAKDQRNATRPNWMIRYLRNPILVLTGLSALATGQILTRVIEENPPFDLPNSGALSALVSSTMTVEEFFLNESVAIRPALPIKIDDFISLTRVNAREKTLEFTYQLSEMIPDLGQETEQLLAIEQCSEEYFGAEIGRGGKLIFTYLGPNDEPINRYVIDAEDCSA